MIFHSPCSLPGSVLPLCLPPSIEIHFSKFRGQQKKQMAAWRGGDFFSGGVGSVARDAAKSWPPPGCLEKPSWGCRHQCPFGTRRPDPILQSPRASESWGGAERRSSALTPTSASLFLCPQHCPEPTLTISPHFPRALLTSRAPHRTDGSWQGPQAPQNHPQSSCRCEMPNLLRPHRVRGMQTVNRAPAQGTAPLEQAPSIRVSRHSRQRVRHTGRIDEGTRPDGDKRP